MDLEKLEEVLSSEEGKGYFDNLAKKQEIKKGRYIRFEKYLEDHNFDELLQRLITENGDEWRDKCYKRGYQPYPNRKLGFVISYVTDNRSSIEVPQLNGKYNFPNQVWFFKGYYFKMTWGQGVFTEIYNNKFERIFAI